MKHLKRFVAITISMVMAFQFCTNDFYLYAETEPADPGQTQVTNEPESGPSDSTGEAAEETPPSDIGTPEPSAPVEEQPAAPVEEQPAPPVEEQPEVASTLKVEFVDVNNASVKETVEQALKSKYVKETINLDELEIDINVEGYTLTEVKDKNDNTQFYTTETKDFVLTGNVTELQFVYEKIPDESNDSESENAKTNEDLNSIQKNHQELSVNILSTEQMISVKINRAGTEEDGQIAAGNITEETAPKYDGYTFVNATVGNDVIQYVGQYNDRVYYSIDGETGMLLEKGQDIVLNYEVTVNTYPVTYIINDETLGTVQKGADKVREGESTTFRVTPNYGNTIESVTVNENPIDGKVVDKSTNATDYVINNVTGDQEVKINFKKTESFQFTYDNGDIRQGNITSPESGFTFQNGETFSFTLKSKEYGELPDGGGKGGEWHLNQLNINGYYINLPTSFDNSALNKPVSTDLPNGVVVEVEMTERNKDGHGYNFTYEVTITGAKENIEVTSGNFKLGGRYEIIIKELGGIEAIYYGEGNKHNNWKEKYINDVMSDDDEVHSTYDFRFTLVTWL